MTNENTRLDWLCTAGAYFVLKTARENILFGNREATEEELEKAIEIAFKRI